MNYIFIDSKDGINKVGIVEDEELVEYYTEEDTKEKLVGNIYRARVVNVLKGMSAAFVDIGEGKNGYLYVKDALSKEQLASKHRYRISEVLKAGEDIIVQVIKEPLGEKGPKITTHISIPGRYLVFTPFIEGVNISRKIKNKKEIKRLKSIGRKLSQEGYGIIFRTISKGIDEELLRDEYKSLVKTYEKVMSQKNFLPTPKRLYKEMDLPYKIVRDNFNKKDYEIIVNSKEIYDNLLQLDEYFSYGLKHRIKLDLEFSNKYNKNIEKGIRDAFKRKVELKSGGYIVIDETEALTAIDVNTGKYTGTKSLSDTVVNINLEATKEIARQIRLRDIGGIIIIDFIDMKSKKDISLLIKRLKNHFRADRNKPNIVDITKLGLVEVTRKKIRPTLDSRISMKCPRCGGRGRIQN